MLFSSFSYSGHGGWLGGQGCLPAALMALEDVNNRSDLLSGYKLRLHWRDSQVMICFYEDLRSPLHSPQLHGVPQFLFFPWFQCNPGKAASEMYDLLYDPPTKLMMLGGCSIVSSTIGEAAKMWNLVVVWAS